MRYIENNGCKQTDIDRGYLDTGAIPDEGDNVITADSDESMRKREEAKERKMYKDMGIESDTDVGGFLERNNCDDRM